MDSWAEEVLALAKRLPREDRLRLVEELQKEDSESNADDVEAAWRDVVVRRIQRFAAGRTEMLAGETVVQQLRAKYTA